MPYQSAYIGRFAPTPSGPLHLGSLLTALASWLAARAAQGQWRLRIDDLDRLRCAPGAESVILRQLEAHGLHWDGPVARQSEHLADYAEALQQLAAGGRLYNCICTRALLAEQSLNGPDGPVYSGACRCRQPLSGETAALRLRIPQQPLLLQDELQGAIRRQSGEVGDFVLRRADGLIGYQLACVVDEALMGISHVLRGADLIGSSLRQNILQAALALPTPRYAHLPVLLGPDGRKLSKQNGAAALDENLASTQISRCLALLGHPPPAELLGASPAQLLAWALLHWDWARLPRGLSLKLES